MILKLYFYLYKLNKNRQIYKNSENTQNVYLFSYGSNSIEQLKNRLNKSENLIYYPGYINNYTRIFAGSSKRWDNGGIASIYPCEKSKVYGIIVEITEKELISLDLYEGGYNRIIMKGYNQTLKREEDVYVYVKENNKFQKFPSNSYMEAIDKMLNNRITDINIDIHNIERKISIKGIIKDKLVTLGIWKYDNLLISKK
jgi:hypothetical protein